MSRRRVRGETCSRPASSGPGQYRRACSSDSNRSVRVLVLAMSPSSRDSGQEVAAMARSVGLDRERNPASQRRKAQTMTTGTPITGDLAASGQADASTADGERADLLATLAKNRHFLRFTTRSLTDEQARQRTTVSELCLGGLIKHVTAAEQGWVNFILEGTSAMKDFTAMTEDDYAQRADQFRLLPGETLAAVLADYAEVARRTDELVASLPSLNVATRCRRPPGSSPAHRGRPARCSCTSSPKPHSTPATPTSSANPWTGPSPWADPPGTAGDPRARRHWQQLCRASLHIHGVIVRRPNDRTGGGAERRLPGRRSP